MNKTVLVAAVLTFLLVLGSVCVFAPPVFAQSDTTSEITTIVLAWMPLIIVFAMLGMILGMLKKLGKF